MRRSNDILDNSQDPVEALAREAFELGHRYATEEAALRQFYLASLEELKTIVRTTTEIDAPCTIAVVARNPSLIERGDDAMSRPIHPCHQKSKLTSDP